MPKDRPISDFYLKDGVDKEAIEKYLKQLEEERKQFIEEQQRNNALNSNNSNNKKNDK